MTSYTKSIPQHLHIAALIHDNYTYVEKIVRDVNAATGERVMYVDGKYQLLTELKVFGGAAPTHEYLDALGLALWTDKAHTRFARVLALMSEPRGYSEITKELDDMVAAHSRYRDIVGLMTEIAVFHGIKDNGYKTVRHGAVDSYEGSAEFYVPFIGRIVANGYGATGDANSVRSGYISFTRTGERSCVF